MTITTMSRPLCRHHALVLAVALAGTPALAFEFERGDLRGELDNHISAGIGWALSNPDKSLIGVGNGGTASTLSSDDHRLNFNKGDVYTQVFKGLHGLTLEYENVGLFVRGQWWYDVEQQDRHQRLYDISNSGRYRYARTSGIELLDAYAFARWQLGGQDGEIRVGRQVVTWGNDDYTHALNDLYAYNGNAYRRPGMILEETLIPAPMVYLTQQLGNDVSVDLFYQFGWEKMAVSNCGTFFATTEVVQDGCVTGNLIYGSDFRPNDPDYLYIPRYADNTPKDGGEYGVALRWKEAALKDTEFGLIASRYHSRSPFYSTIASSVLDVTDPQFDPNLVGNSPLAGYTVDYPESIELYAATFRTELAEGATSFSGELSLRPNMPLQVNSTDLTYTALGIDAIAQQTIGAPISPTVLNGDAVSEGKHLRGYRRLPVSQVQLAFSQFLPGAFGADWFLFMSEVAWNHISDLKTGPGAVRFGRDSIYGYGEVGVPGLCETLLNTDNPQHCNGDGFHSRDSWGYRSAFIADFADVGGGVGLRPMLVWTHDMHGWGPNFNQEAKSIELSVSARYRDRYSATVTVKDYFGGRYNTWVDRDFVSLSVGMSF
ncbi:DUF1302 domain-containing protein [Isoalcanivorax beigongshangi]|uniref:DUF1302 domain-containing protein n=1 Tax=Isoalcanivorax beigongshangi TaxID=3238810 RepID=A0ABV4AFS8_9GAMM